MKKKLALLLTIVMAVGLFAGCGGKESKGSVYYLNFKPEADAAWQELAKTYKEQTGVDVKVVTAASGTYSETLTAEMSKSSAPTLFQCGNQAGLDTWKDYCLDLKDTDFYKEMTTDDFNLKGENGEVFCVGYCYEAFGIITNVKLLGDAGYSLEDIKDFASLKSIAEDITARSSELGFSAFTSAGLDSSSSWRFTGHLANMPLYYEFRDDNVTSQPAAVTGAYLDNYKSTWEYANLTGTFGMNPDDLAMIPIYCGVSGEENAALCCGTENCWAVNSKASEADIKATLDFMKWVVTSEEGTQMMAREFGPIPFKNAKASENVFFTILPT